MTIVDCIGFRIDFTAEGAGKAVGIFLAYNQNKRTQRILLNFNEGRDKT